MLGRRSFLSGRRTHGGGFWSTETLRKKLPHIVFPYDDSAVKSCCYELTVGGEAFVTGENTDVIALDVGEKVAIPPGQVILILTHEKLNVPLDAIGFLSIKLGKKLRGLINVSGFHVDPGFQGKLVFSMYNAGVQTIHLGFRSPLFILWFCSIDDSTRDKYKGDHNHQEHLPDDAVTNLAARMPSPFTLEDDVESLRTELHREVNILKVTLGVVSALLIANLAASIRSCSSPPPSGPPVAVYLDSISGPGSSATSTLTTPLPTASATNASPKLSGTTGELLSAPSLPPLTSPAAALAPAASPNP